MMNKTFILFQSIRNKLGQALASKKHRDPLNLQARVFDIEQLESRYLMSSIPVTIPIQGVFVDASPESAVFRGVNSARFFFGAPAEGSHASVLNFVERAQAVSNEQPVTLGYLGYILSIHLRKQATITLLFLTMSILTTIPSAAEVIFLARQRMSG